MTILLSPFTRPRRDGKPNAKNYPHWNMLIPLLEAQHRLIQIGVTGEPALVKEVHFSQPFDFIKQLAEDCDTFLSVDSFFPHMMNTEFPEKRGVVLFGPSDPRIFGYSQNLNLYKDKSYFRPDQYGIWEAWEANPAAHVEPMEVVMAFFKIKRLLEK